MHAHTTRLLFVLIVALAATLPAAANTFTVNVTNDEVDGPCVPGDCSLREAIIAANANPGPDDVVLQGGQTYTLSITGAGENAAATGDLDITETIAIYTPFGSGQATIQAAPGFGDRIFHINPNLANTFIGVRFENLHIVGGNTNSTGGGIMFDGVNPANLSQLRLTACSIEGNTAALGGGGIWAKDLDTVFVLNTFDAAISSSQCNIKNNIVTNGDGGGFFINNCPFFINLPDTGIFGNEASGNGGGVFYTGGASAGRTASIFGIVANNVADRDNNGSGDGGGIYISNTASVTIGGSAGIGMGGGRGNRAVNGGGIANFGTLQMFASGASFLLVSDNRSKLNGAGLYNSGASASVTATGNIVFQQNNADSDNNGTGDGGGIFNNGGSFSMNGGATFPGGQFLGNNNAVNGAGMATNGGTMTISTVAASGNNATTNGGVLSMSGGTVTICEMVMVFNNANGTGGAISKTGGTLTMHLSRVLNNFSATASGIANAGSTPNLEDNWWGCDNFPVLEGNPNPDTCPTFTGTIDSNPRIDLRFIPTANTIPPNGSSILTADVTRNTDGNIPAACNGPRPSPIVMEGLHVGFSLASPILGTLTTTNGTIVNGQAITQFNAGATPGTQDAFAQVDNGFQLGQIVITSPVQTADLNLTKGVDNATPNVGQNVTFTITIHNSGPNTATNVAVRDLLPAGLTFVSASSGAYNSVNGVWTIGSMTNGATQVLTITATVASAGAKINTAQVSASDTFDPDSLPNNNNAAEDDQASVTVTPQTADLSMNKTVTNAAPIQGNNTTFTLTVSNAGPNTATGVQVTDVLPAGLTWVSDTSGGAYNTGTGIWTVPSIASLSSQSIQITVTAATTGAKTNTAEITAADQADPDSTPNNHNQFEDDQKSVVVNPVSPNADLSLTKTVDNPTPPVGTNVVFTIIVSNAGPNIATNVSVLDQLPVGLTYVTNTTTQGTYDQTTGIWTIGTINNGSNATLTITATVATPGTKTNTAQVRSSDQPDPDSTPNNNNGAEDDQKSVSVTPPQADLSVTKTVDVPTPVIGQSVTFTVTLHNGGPGNATNVVVTDVLPAGYTFTGSTVTQGTYTSGTGVWSVGTLANGGNAVLTITGTVNAAGIKTNTAQVTAVDQSDPDSTPNNNNPAEDDQASATPTVRPGVSKAFVPAAIQPGGTSTLTITLTNPNGVPTTGAAFTDTYGSALLVNNGTASTTCAGGTASTPTANSVALAGGTIPALGTCTVTVPVTSNTAGFYSNSLAVGGVSTTNHGTSGNATSATLAVFIAPTITKAFSPASILTGGTSQITITLGNTNATPMTNAAFTDTYPANLVNSGTASTTCGGTASTPTAGSLQLTGATIPANGTCTVTVNVTSSVGGSYTNTIPAGGLTTDGGPNTVAASDTLTVVGPPVVSKSFAAPEAGVGTNDLLSIDIQNTNTVSLTGVSFTDTLPAGVATSGAIVSNTCGGTASSTANSVSLSGGTIAASTTCTVSINVISATAGDYTNTIAAGDVTTSNSAPNASPASANVSFLARPVVTKAFNPNVMPDGQQTTLTITLTNPNATHDITDAAFTDTYPAGLTSAFSPSTDCPGGTASAPTSGEADLTGATIPAGGQCTVTVILNATGPGSYTNTIAAGAVTSDNAGSNTVAASDTLIVTSPPTVAKSFSPISIGTDDNSLLTITLTNPNPVAITSVSMTDNYPGNVVNAATPGETTTCSGGTLIANSGGSAVFLTNATIAANSSCTVKVFVTSGFAGSYDNTINAGDVSSAETSSNSLPATANLLVLEHPTVDKAFSPTEAGVGVPSTITITLSNSNSTAITGVAMTDTYPTNMVNAPTPNASTTCGGTVATPTTGSLTLSGGTIPANGTCTVTVSVVGNAAGTYTNTIAAGAVTSANAGSNLEPVGADLDVLAGPAATKSFAPTGIPINGTSTLTINLTNPNSVPITGVSFTDTYPLNVVNKTPLADTNTCGGVLTATAGGNSVALSGGTIPVAGCTITIDVTSATAGSYQNTIAAGDITSGNAGSNTAAASATLNVLQGLGVAKAFSPNTIPVSGTSTLTITLTNSNSTAINGAAFTDTYDTDIVNTTPVNFSTTCGGTVTATAGTNSVSLSGGTVPANATCTVTIDVTSSVVGSQPNTIAAGDVTSTNGGANTLPTTDNLIVMAPPSVAKTITPASIPSGGTATLSITLTNTNAQPITGVAFTDNYDPALDNAATPSVTDTCGGSVTATAGASSLALAGGTIPANGTCTITVAITSVVPGTHTNTIAIGDVTSGNAGSNTAATSDDLEVIAAPTVTKAFSPATILAGGATQLTITLSNSNGSDITGAGFTDAYPAGVFNAATPNASTTCAGGIVGAASGGGSLTLSGATIPKGNSCTVTVTLTSAAIGSHLNTIGVGTVTSANAPANTAAASDTLLVLGPPSVAKQFTPNTMSVGNNSQLTITLTNPNASTAITGVNFTDAYPANLVNATPSGAATTCGGTVNATNGGGSVGLTGGTIAAGGTCTVTINVTTPTAGNYPNTIAAGDVTSSTGANTAPATATLSVGLLPPPTVAKSFNPTSIPIGGTSTLTITLTNPNAQALTGVAFTDTYPAGTIVNATPANGSTTCGGTATAANGGGSVSLASGLIPANSSCTVTVLVTSTVVGNHTNTIAAGDVTPANAAPNAAPASATLSVGLLTAPGVTKSFTPSFITPGQPSMITITLTNPNAQPITGVTFTDNYPAGLVNTASPNAASTCGGVVTATAAGTSLSLTGGTIAANGSCSVTVMVTTTGAGTFQNTLPAGSVTSANAAPSGAAGTALLTAAALTGANVPALDWRGLIAMALLLAAVAVVVIRR